MAELKAIALKEYEDDLESLTVLLDSRVSEILLESLHERLQIGKAPKRVRLWPRIAAVAAAVAMVVFGVWFFNYRGEILRDALDDKSVVVNDIAPGKNGATLTLTDGRQIKLNDIVKGEIAGQAGVSIVKTANGQVMYQFPKGYEWKDQLHGVSNTLSTGKGETYIVILPDGTKVWLNAVSSLEFDPRLHSHGRVVKLTGEAYFEVAKDKKRPFIVISEGQEVRVLGTHFNISAYRDEGSIKTTLLEGSVKVSGRDPSELGMTSGRGTALSSSANAKDLNAVVLKPNQQSVITGSNRIVVKEVDVNEILAWKNGDFIFSKESLTNIMNSIARWYDVEVAYDPGVDTDQTFSVLVSRNKNISQILRSLEQTGKVKFKIEGGKVYVQK